MCLLLRRTSDPNSVRWVLQCLTRFWPAPGLSTCSAQVEPGWTCSPTSPSVCTTGGSAHTHDVPSPDDPHIGPDAPPPAAAGGGGAGPSTGGGGSGGAAPPAPKHHRSGWAIAAIVLAAVGTAGTIVYAGRERIYDNFPQARVLCLLCTYVACDTRCHTGRLEELPGV